MNPFKTFKVRPNFGFSQALIEWELAAGVVGDVYFYRSESGVQGSWEIINPADPETGLSGEFLDTTAVNDLFNFVHYRGVVDAGGAEDDLLKGPDVTALETYERSEYFLAREILRREFKSMAGPRGNGKKVWHFVPRTSGLEAPNADLETRQILGPDCPEDPNSGFGTEWRGGFFPPVPTWTRIITLADLARPDRKDGTGDDADSTISLRMLVFPKPDKGHILVFPEGDRRYVILPPVKPFYLRGNIPLFWEAQASILDHDDARHRLYVPPWP